MAVITATASNLAKETRYSADASRVCSNRRSRENECGSSTLATVGMVCT